MYSLRISYIMSWGGASPLNSYRLMKKVINSFYPVVSTINSEQYE